MDSDEESFPSLDDALKGLEYFPDVDPEESGIDFSDEQRELTIAEAPKSLREALQAIRAREQYVDLSGLEVLELEPMLHFHPSLVHLNASSNELDSLPPEFAQLTALSELRLRSNQFNSVPDSLLSLQQLEYLDLSLNRISEVPSEIANLVVLSFLDLSDNNFLSVPSSMGKLVALEVLDLSGNRLARLPLDVGKCRKLRTFSASYNSLKALPESIGRLRNLEVLDVAHNELSAIPSEIRSLKNLETLDLESNFLFELPMEVGELRSLRTLRLAKNGLNAIPSSLGKLHNLTELDLSDNDLKSLPPELGQLPENISLNLLNNPLEEPLNHLAAQGTQAVLTYLRGLEHSTPQFEAKLLFVGEGGVGKSSLAAALREEAFVENRATTHGIEIEKLEVRHPLFEDTKIVLNTWDFGGQEVYRISHQFFFSRRALYLLVWKPREGQEENSIESWCRRIRLRVGDQAKVIIVATHASERRPELDFQFLRARYPYLLAANISVDSEFGEGIEALSEEISIYASQLPQMGELIPNRWSQVRDRIGEIDTAQITRYEYEQICFGEGLDTEESRTLAALLHDLGQIICYTDTEGLRDLVVLRPEWLTRAIGYVLEDEETRELGGVITHDRLSRIWSTGGVGREGYPPELHPYFLRLMEKFDISYRLPDEESSLVAQLVPYERPSGIWQTAAVPSKDRRILRSVCRLADEATGIISWLTVRYQRFSVNKHWRRGVLLRHDAYRSEAVIELMSSNRELSLTVVGPAPDYFFHILKDGVEELLTLRWRHLSYDFWVPCPTTEEGVACRGMFPYASLRKFRERGESKIPCGTCAEWADVEVMLTGFERKDETLEGALAEIRQAQEDASKRLYKIEVAAAETAKFSRTSLKILSAEVTDCPRLFTFLPVDRSLVVKTISTRRNFQIKLWCEEFGMEHPCDGAVYQFKPSKEWVHAVGPYVKFVAKALRVVVPLAGAAYAVSLSEGDLKEVKAEIDLAKVLAEKFPEPELIENPRGEGGMSRTEGAGLRAFRLLLTQLDSTADYGGLKRVLTSSGDLIWVCPEHYALYDPGLPSLSQV